MHKEETERGERLISNVSKHAVRWDRVRVPGGVIISLLASVRPRACMGSYVLDVEAKDVVKVRG